MTSSDDTAVIPSTTTAQLGSSQFDPSCAIYFLLFSPSSELYSTVYTIVVLLKDMDFLFFPFLTLHISFWRLSI